MIRGRSYTYYADSIAVDRCYFVFPVVFDLLMNEHTVEHDLILYNTINCFSVKVSGTDNRNKANKITDPNGYFVLRQ